MSTVQLWNLVCFRSQLGWYLFTAEKECKTSLLFEANPHRIHMFNKIDNMLKNKILLGNMSEVKVVAKIIRNLKLVIKLLRALRFLRKDDFLFASSLTIELKTLLEIRFFCKKKAKRQCCKKLHFLEKGCKNSF